MTNEMPIMDAHTEGYAAFIAEDNRNENPHTDRVLRRAWFEGYDQAERDYGYVVIDADC